MRLTSKRCLVFAFYIALYAGVGETLALMSRRPTCGAARVRQTRAKYQDAHNLTLHNGGSVSACLNTIHSRTLNLSDATDLLPFTKVPFVLTSSACNNRSLKSCAVHQPTDPFAGSRWSSCAVVGNGRSMLESGIGHEIDVHEAVFRINMAPVLGFQHDVGSKTTVRFSFPPICGSIAGHTYEEAHICMNAGSSTGSYEAFLKMRDAFSLVLRQIKLDRARTNQTASAPSFFASSREFDRLALNAGIVPSGPTSGLSALLFALSNCDHVSAYGFTAGLLRHDFPGPVKLIRAHYYDDKDIIDIGKSNPHKYNKEGDFLASVHQTRLIYHWDAENVKHIDF